MSTCVGNADLRSLREPLPNPKDSLLFPPSSYISYRPNGTTPLILYHNY